MNFRVLRSTVLCLALSLMLSAPAFSANAAEMKIGVMDLQKIMTQSEPGIKVKKAMEEKQKELQAALEGDQKTAQALQEEIKKKSSVWSKEKKDEKVLEFNKLRRDLQTKADDARLEMKQMQDKELAPLIKALEEVVDEYGAREKYSIILDSRSGVVYFDKAYDISDELIKEINGKMK